MIANQGSINENALEDLLKYVSKEDLGLVINNLTASERNVITNLHLAIVSEFPNEISYLSNLKNLDMCINPEFKLPKGIQMLSQVKELSVTGEHFEDSTALRNYYSSY